MCGLLSEAIEPEANRRLLPPAPSPREGVWGWGNVRDFVPSPAKGKAGLWPASCAGLLTYIELF